MQNELNELLAAQKEVETQTRQAKDDAASAEVRPVVTIEGPDLQRDVFQSGFAMCLIVFFSNILPTRSRWLRTSRIKPSGSRSQ
mmetsp:Transcript_52230/g.102263  ORF Transcript_52230/g.102263 Transcript_52230/m.102263 type:complete len:84 (-) Transcript_52230:1344-1595(-)